MRIEFMDGWPYLHPRILVDDISVDHTNAAGEVCLWEYSTRDRTWLTLKGIHDRAEEWVAAASAGFPDDAVLDAHLYFERRRHGIATANLGDFARRQGSMGRIGGRWRAPNTLQLSNRGGESHILGRYYVLGPVRTPPRNVDHVRALLEKNQAESFDALLKAAANDKSNHVALLLWSTPNGFNALTLIVAVDNAKLRVRAMETAPTDESYLAARAGPDFGTLQSKNVVLFGAGAVGSHLAVRLAECGLGSLTLHDNEPVRPGNVVRHVARREQVGLPKRQAVQTAITERVPWTTVTLGDASWDPDKIIAAIDAADLVLDATGSAALTDLLSEICRRTSTAVIATALYRGGAVGRICRQAVVDDKPICDRHLAQDPRYPLIPPGDEPTSLEPGCTSPVNNAPPSAVAALAGRTAEIVIDTLTGRLDYPDEFIEVYRALDQAPFDQVGAVRLER
jgi:molybdopterin/thiamine biosynthesis adenylyltransferase